MTEISLERVASALGYSEKPNPDTHRYANVTSANPDGSYQVTFNGAVQSTRAVKLCDAEVGDRVFCVIFNGQVAAIGKVGGFGGARIELLWTNPSPSASFSDQTLTFSGTYSAYIITSTGSSSYGATVSTMLPVGVNVTIYAPSASSSNGYRGAETTASTIKFTSGSSSSHCIPYAIWGVR